MDRRMDQGLDQILDRIPSLGQIFDQIPRMDEILYQILHSPALLGLLLLSFVVYFANQRFGPKYDPKEPPVLPQRLPYLGHLIGLWRHGLSYYRTLSAKHNKPPIYTLQMLNVKIYVINAPELVAAAQRNSKNLLFSPLLGRVVPGLFGVDKDAASLTRKNMQDENGEWLNTHPMNMANYVNLQPGPNLDATTRKMQRNLNPIMDQLSSQSQGDEDTTIGLYAWVKNSFCLATTEAIYGRENPYKLQPELIDSFWDMTENIMLLLVPILPRLIARKAYNARQQLFDAMNRYFTSSWRDDASELIKARYDAFRKVNMPIDAIARYEMGDSLAVMVNTVPALFWVLNYIYLEPTLLEELREEITASVLVTTDEQTGTKTHHLDVKRLQDECELLTATLQEVLRLQTDNVTSRWVVRDTILDTTNTQHLLRKDSIVHVPAGVLHHDPLIWGRDVHEFNPGRFFKGHEKHHPAAFRVFGGGATLCPGRIFAAAEILSFVAMTIMRFELTPVNYGWRKLVPMKANVANSIPGPSADIRVRVKVREGVEKGDRWIFC